MLLLPLPQVPTLHWQQPDWEAVAADVTRGMLCSLLVLEWWCCWRSQVGKLPVLQLACCTSASMPPLTSCSCPRLQMELRYHEVDKARNIYERYVRCLPTVKAWVRYAKFEMQNGQVGLARRCYERAIEQLGEDAQTVWPVSAELLA